MTTFLPSEPHAPQSEAFPDGLPTPPPAEWMPLDEIAQAWATFGASTRHPWGWQATSSAFAALSQEAAALQQLPDESQRSAPVRVPTTITAAPAAALDPYEATCVALEEGLACWQSALLWLEQLARHLPPVVACGEDLGANGQDASLALDALLALSRWQRCRLRALLARLSLPALPASPTLRPVSLSLSPRHQSEVRP